MTKLHDEFQQIVDEMSAGHVGAEDVALRIQEYIDAKEPVMLTDEEIITAYYEAGVASPIIKGVRSAIAAHIAKQKLPRKRKVTVHIYLDANGLPLVSESDLCDYLTLKHTQEIEYPLHTQEIEFPLEYNNVRFARKSR